MYILKHDKTLINDYILCNYIDETKVSKLEDDAEFMREVLIATNDTKMYFFCSDRLKRDIKFNMFVIEYFISKGIDVNDIVVSYFKLSSDNVQRKEFELYLAELSFKYCYNIYLKKYRNLVIKCYVKEMENYQKAISKMNDERVKNYYGIGFFFVMDKYNSSKRIKDFYARSIFGDIIASYNVESELHKKFDNPQEVIDYGLNKFLLDIINIYDKHLKNYLIVNYGLMSEEVYKIDCYLKRWDMYDTKLADYVLKKINQYFKQKEDNHLPQNEAIIYAINKLHLQNVFNKSNNFQKTLKLVISKKDDTIINENNLEVSEMITLLEIEKIMRKEILGEKEVVCGDSKNLIKVDFMKNN